MAELGHTWIEFLRFVWVNLNPILDGPLIQLILGGGGIFYLKLGPKKWGNGPNNDGPQKYGYLSDKKKKELGLYS